MKKLIIICFFLATCNPTNVAWAQKKTSKSAKAQKLEDAWAELKKSKDTTAMLITDIKRLSNQEIIYRTKLSKRVDTVWRIDTCITVFTPIDSATIAILFKNREVPKRTAIGKVFHYIFYKKKK